MTNSAEDTPNCRVIRQFVTEEERRALLDKAERHFAEGHFVANPTGPFRYIARLQAPPLLDDLVETMTRRVVKAFGLAEVSELQEPIGAGGFIQGHQDRLSSMRQWMERQGRAVDIPEDAENFRCNIMVQMADESGYPVIGGESIEMSEGDCWGFFASRHSHGTHVIEGGTRIIYGFGFIVPGTFEPVADVPSSAQGHSAGIS